MQLDTSFKAIYSRSVMPLLAGGLALSTIACGGSSSGDPRNVSGTWSGTVTEVNNTCSPGLAFTSGSFTHIVSQNNEAVSLTDDASGLQYLGNIVGDDGFAANAVIADDEQPGGTLCSVEQEIAYDEIDSDSDLNAEVKIDSMLICADGSSCLIQSEGSAIRSSSTPDPDPLPMPEPATCLDLIERTYTGDGGCGINSTTVDVRVNATENDLLVLSPFGGNGATSFAINESDTTMASSNRNDLEINAGPDYSCSIVCDGEITFTLSCFQEGGDVCEERF